MKSEQRRCDQPLRYRLALRWRGFSAMVGSLVIMLAACDGIAPPPELPQPPEPSAIASPTDHTPTPTPASPPQTRPHRQSLNPTPSPVAKREDYQPMALSDLGDANTRKGNDPQAIALSIFGNNEAEGGSQTLTVEYPQTHQAVVILTHLGVADDSVFAIRYRVEFQQNPSTQSGQQWQMVWAGSQVKCHQGRGHQNWSTELCL